MSKIKVSTTKIGSYGRMRLDIIKQERSELYTQLLFSDGLEEYSSTSTTGPKSAY